MASTSSRCHALAERYLQPAAPHTPELPPGTVEGAGGTVYLTTATPAADQAGRRRVPLARRQQCVERAKVRQAIVSEEKPQQTSRR